MQLRRESDGLVRTPPMPNSPTVTVLFGGEEGGPDVGLAKVLVPAGAGMPPHQHDGSDVILTALSGCVRIDKGQASLEVHTGDSALIGKDETVSLTNPESEPAQLLVAAGPADFVGGIRSWPEPDQA